ncbi:MAG: YbaB/EbfC family nucleoid-associated protein [Planctomycetaceae bacterium]|jgi:DNA-binding YbaB/EbfC family protein|nr:YbaB/EbfC family nucleoid-associated protein [Planctomycetaceae bacterium]
MFKEIMNLGSMMKKAQELTSKMNEMKEQVKHISAEGSAGGGMVTAKMNGQFELLACKIDPALLTADNQELLEDMIIAAVNDSCHAVKEKVEAEVGNITSGLDISHLMESLGKNHS